MSSSIPDFFNSINKKLSVFLKKIDIFGIKTELKMSSKSKFKSTIGGCFTLGLISICLLLFLSFGADMFYHENPTAIFSQIFNPTPGRTYFSRDRYFFFFGVEFPNFYHFIDESIYTVTVNNKRVGRTNDSFTKHVEVERCTEDHLPSDPKMKEYFMGATPSPISDLYCLKDIDDYFIEGSYDTEEYTFLEISIFACVNTTNKTTCKPKEEIQSKLSGFFAFYTMDYLIDPTRFTDPGQPVGKDYFTPLSLGIQRYTNRFISDTRIVSDDGFLLTSQNSHSYPSYSYDKETLLLDTGSNGLVMYFLLRKNHNEMIYERKYKKIQNILAEIGGLIQILYLAFFAVSYPCISKQYFEKIINTIYNFESDGEKEKKTQKKKLIFENRVTDVPSGKEKRVSTRKSVFHESTFQNALNELDESLKIHKNGVSPQHRGLEKKTYQFVKYLTKIQKRKPLKTSFWGFIKEKFYNLKKKKPPNIDIIQKEFENSSSKITRLKTARSAIKQKLDISYILKKFYEIDKLKMLLLNEDQYHLFEFSTKPVVLKNSNIDLGNSKNSNFENYENDIVGRAKKMYQAFVNIKKKKKVTELDKRLMELLDNNIKRIFEEDSILSERIIKRELNFNLSGEKSI